MHFLSVEFLGNPLSNWAKALGTTVGLYLVAKVIKTILVNRMQAIAKRTNSNIDNIILEVVSQTQNLLIVLAGIYAGVHFLKISDKIINIIDKAFYVVVAMQVGYWLGGFINHLVIFREKKESGNKEEQTAVHAFGLFGKIMIWTVVALVTIQNVSGMKMDALITSLGVGGIAAGLAVQNILKDIFASLSIFMDKPFLVGDYIQVGDIGGTVENIGLKSTRIRTLLGEEVVFSNSDLLESRLHNYRSMQRRMVTINIGVSPNTPYQTLQDLPALFKEVIEKQKDVTFDRANLSDLGNYTINFEIIYHIESADFDLFVQRREAIYLEIIQRLQEKNVDMPYPTQTVLLQQ
jgi:small-conductance mechanosensitive channel